MADRDEMIEAYREFAREQMLRFERLMRDVDRGLRRLASEIHEDVRHQREELHAFREESRRYHDRQDKRLDELLDESRAQRQALLHILDRLDNGGTAPAS